MDSRWRSVLSCNSAFSCRIFLSLIAQSDLVFAPMIDPATFDKCLAVRHADNPIKFSSGSEINDFDLAHFSVCRLASVPKFPRLQWSRIAPEAAPLRTSLRLRLPVAGLDVGGCF
jgi:hypothetical protein